jgi:hypothetical protein
MEPTVTDLSEIQRRESGQKAVQPVRRPAWADVDRDPARRPGVPWLREPPRPFPNTRFPPERQEGTPTAPMHNRPNKQLPPVFGTAVPLKGLSGVVRRLAYTLPDHEPGHWMIMMLGDRIDSWETRTQRLLPVAAPLALLGLVFHRLRQ